MLLVPPVGFISRVLVCFLQVSTAHPKSSVFYSRSKALTEQALAELGYKDTIMFRPAVLSNTNRPESRLAETAFLYATSPLFCLFCFSIVRQSRGTTGR